MNDIFCPKCGNAHDASLVCKKPDERNDWYIATMSDGSLGIRDKSGFICKMIKPEHYNDQDDRYTMESAEYHNTAALVACAPELYKAIRVSMTVTKDALEDIRHIMGTESILYQRMANAFRVMCEATLESGVPK